jgi:hypothetical protein
MNADGPHYSYTRRSVVSYELPSRFDVGHDQKAAASNLSIVTLRDRGKFTWLESNFINQVQANHLI